MIFFNQEWQGLIEMEYIINKYHDNKYLLRTYIKLYTEDTWNISGPWGIKHKDATKPNTIIIASECSSFKTYFFSDLKKGIHVLG